VSTKRLARAWRLTVDGEAVIDAHNSLRQARRATRKGAKLTTGGSGRRGKSVGHSPRGFPAAERPVNASRPSETSGGKRFRLTALTYEVLTAVANLDPGGSSPTNREIARLAGVKDEGQISRLLARLQAHGLLRNAGGHAVGGNAWQLTPRGEEILSASHPVDRSGEEQAK
jgi:hypothetical protein